MMVCMILPQGPLKAPTPDSNKFGGKGEGVVFVAVHLPSQTQPKNESSIKKMSCSENKVAGYCQLILQFYTD